MSNEIDFDKTKRRITGHSFVEAVSDGSNEHDIYQFECYYCDEQIMKYFPAVSRWIPVLEQIKNKGAKQEIDINEYMKTKYWNDTEYKGLYDDILIEYIKDNIANNIFISDGGIKRDIGLKLIYDNVKAKEIGILNIERSNN